MKKIEVRSLIKSYEAWLLLLSFIFFYFTLYNSKFYVSILITLVFVLDFSLSLIGECKYENAS